MKIMKALIVGCLFAAGCKNAMKTGSLVQTGINWPLYGGNEAGNRYSPLKQINLSNVKDLKVAWTYNSNTQPDTKNSLHSYTTNECQPIVINGVMYATSPQLGLFAIDAATGKQLWKFKTVKEKQRFNTIRGVMYWEKGSDKRVLYTSGSYLYAVNAETGKAVTSFGENGRVNLHEGLSVTRDVSNLSVTVTSPGVIYKNVLVLGSSVGEGSDAAPGYIRGFDVVSGKLLWTFHTIPLPGEPGYSTWPKDAYKTAGGANCWGGLVLDQKTGIVYLGTGSASPNFYGGDHEGIDLFSDCVLALNAETGKLKWYFQTVHHDIWDRDIPCQPNLTTIEQNGKKVNVVVVATKGGLVYVLNRENGTSIFPIEERPVPTKGLPGEHPWPTQRFPLKPAPFSDQAFTDSDITNISPASHDYIEKLISKYDYGVKFLPPSTKGTLTFGPSGGAEWSGNAIDTNGILYQSTNNGLWLLQMISRKEQAKELSSLSQGERLYITNCSICHGMNRKGDGEEIPSLVNIGNRLSKGSIGNILETGRGRMPSFQEKLSVDQRTAIINFLLNIKTNTLANAKQTKDEVPSKGKSLSYTAPYTIKVWREVHDQNGYPGVKPPWGTLNAINLNTGDYMWSVPLGEYPELVKKGIPITGTPNYGGPIVTAGGIIFMAAAMDGELRAFDKNTGKVVWEYKLPAAGFATPITYEVNGKQYIAIAAGGGRGLKSSGIYIAFALPAKDR